MREIKFRAWDAEERIMIDADSFAFTEYELLSSLFKNSGFEFMQFTGLYDSQGREIYEGDVVHGSYGVPPVGVDSVVEYDGAAFIIRTKGHKPESVTLFSGLKYLSLYVIGNIYENSELNVLDAQMEAENIEPRGEVER